MWNNVFDSSDVCLLKEVIIWFFLFTQVIVTSVSVIIFLWTSLKVHTYQ